MQGRVHQNEEIQFFSPKSSNEVAPKLMQCHKNEINGIGKIDEVSNCMSSALQQWVKSVDVSVHCMYYIPKNKRKKNVEIESLSMELFSCTCETEVIIKPQTFIGPLSNIVHCNACFFC